MIRNEFTIIDQHGMHARPAAALVKLSRLFRSEITISRDGRCIQPKSLLNILSLALKYGDRITVEIAGDDEREAAETIGHFFTEEMKKF